MVWYHSDKTTVSVCFSVSDHDECLGLKDKDRGLSEEIKNIISDLLAKGPIFSKPKYISRDKNNIDQSKIPSYKQIANFKQMLLLREIVSERATI
jgi:hypothetical protein